MPLRSGGCYKCRSRKIRCDETRPRCRRCDTHGVLCPGYKYERSGEIEIRDQTKLTVQRVCVVSATKNRSHPGRNDKKAKSSEHPCPLLFDVTISRRLGHHVQELPSLAEILSPAVYRSKLYSAFIRLYVPQGHIPRDASLEFYQLDFIKTVASLSSASPAVVHALDAVSLVQVGSIHNDQQLLHEGVKSYMCSLKNLSASLSQSDCAKDDYNLVAASILTLCEFYDEIKQRGHGWISHLQGTQKLLEARGPHSIDSHLSRFVYWNTVHSSIANGLIRRKAAKPLTDEWLALESKLLPFCEYGESCNIGRILTSLLERHDQLDLSQPNILQDIDALIVDCKRLEDDMAAFYPQNTNWPLKSITCFSCFQNAASNVTVSHAYDFPSYMPALMQSQYWLRMYFLRANMQSLYALRGELFDKNTEEIIEDSEIMELVLNLCRCVPFFAEPCNATIGHISCFLPLHVAAYFFHEKRLWPWLRWVRSTRKIIFDRGLSMPKLGLPEMPPEAEEEILYQELADKDGQAPYQAAHYAADKPRGAGRF